MARLRNSDKTRTLLIEAASRLFASKGYEGTTVETVIQQASVSKGAFYHHFSSKADLLDAIATSVVAAVVDAVRTATEGREAGAVARLNRFLAASAQWKLARIGLLKEVAVALYRDENTRLRRKIQAESTTLIAPLLTDILRQGIDERVFDAPSPEDAALLIMQLTFATQEQIAGTLLDAHASPEGMAALKRQTNLYVEMLERMLGAPRGSIERLHFAQSSAGEAAEEAHVAEPSPAGAS
jgi:AcrR family transcriptional regulator